MNSLDRLLDDLQTAVSYKVRRRRIGKSRPKKLRRQMSNTFNEDSAVHHSAQAADAGGVVLGVYGAEDWILARILQDRFLAGEATLQLDGTWLTPADFGLAKWASDNFQRYSFFGASSVTGFTAAGGCVKVQYSRGKIEVEILSNPEEANHWFAHFEKHFRKAENLIQWVYNGRGDDIQVPLNYRPALRSAYPFIDPSYESLTDYIDEYIDSPASVLILIGAPGTGKTTFIKNLIHRSKADAKVAYDPKVMAEDSFFAGFIGDDTRFLIMEDADEFLQSRSDGNTMMHKFLNVADGLVSAVDKKMVFSTNLPNVGDIDQALMRPGRCFDVLQFRKLTRDEALEVLSEVGSERVLPDGSEFSLAEVFSSQPSGRVFSRRKIGFV